MPCPAASVAVDRNFAWEKAIVLTPRPDIARTMMQMYFDAQFEAELRAEKGRTSKDDLKDVEGRSEKRVNDLYFFPTKVRVSGRQIEFLVPTEFLGGVPEKSWAYTVVVTGTEHRADRAVPATLGRGRPTMMTMGVARGRALVAVGHPRRRRRGHAAGDRHPRARSGRAAHGARPTTTSWPGGSPLCPGSPRTATWPWPPPASRSPWSRPRASTRAAGGGAPARLRPRRPRSRTVPARLRTLNQLLEDGLITQDEFNELRRKILAEL